MIKQSIIEHYKFELNLLLKRDKNALGKMTLMMDLEKVRSITELKNLLKNCCGLIKQSSPNLFPADNLATKLNTWYKKLTQIETSLEEAKKTLLTTESTFVIKPLLALLTDVLNNSDAKLHCYMLALLAELTNSTTQQMFSYLASLKHAPPPIAPPAGSFAALIPRNEVHAGCIALLNNVAAVASQEHQNPCWVQANSVLQNLLLIYRDLPDEPKNDYAVSSPCTIL